MGLAAIFYSPAAIALQDRLLLWVFSTTYNWQCSLCVWKSVVAQEKISPSFQVIAGLLTWWLGGVGVEGETSLFQIKLDPRKC